MFPILIMSLQASSAAGSSQSFSVDAEASDVYVQISPDEGRLLSGLSHEHVVVARKLEGEVRWDPERPAECWVEIEVPVDGLDVDPEPKRKALGFDKELSDGDRKKVERNMRAKNQLWAEKYPIISFRATRCRVEEDSIVRLEGSLTIRGVSKDVSLPVRVDRDEEGLRARVEFEQMHANFGFDPYSNLLGALKNDESIRFHVDIRATATSTSATTPARE